MKSNRLSKIILIIFFCVILVACQNSNSNINHKSNNDKKMSEVDMNTNKKILVVYFSQTGSTKRLAKYATDILHVDSYEIIAAKPYTEKDLEYYTNGRADQEQSDSSIRPKISGEIKNMDEYDKIILGYPIWHGQAPRIINTFLESYDFSQKTILPFCTSHSSDIGSSASDLHSYTSTTTTWLEGKRFGVETSKKEIEDFLNSIFD